MKRFGQIIGIRPEHFTNLANNPDYANVVSEFKEKLMLKLREVRTNDLDL